MSPRRVRVQWSFRARSIRWRLVGAFVVLGVLLAGGAGVVYQSLRGSASTAAETLESLRREARYAAQLSSTVAEEIQTGLRYLHSGDSVALARFQRLMLVSHRITRNMNRLTARTSEHVALVAAMDRGLADLEVLYSRGHRLREEGDLVGAVGIERAAEPLVRQLMTNIDRLGALTERRVSVVSSSLQLDAEQRALWLAAIFAAILIAGTFVVGTTLRSILRPLRGLVGHAEALRRGAYDMRTAPERMPGEFQTLASALNDAGESLAVLHHATSTTANDLATSASELSQVSDRIALTATEVSNVMSSVTRGAENQVAMLKRVDHELEDIGDRIVNVRQEAGSVAMLAVSIEREAGEKLQSVGRALGVMTEIKEAVQDASQSAHSLHGVTEHIAGFVTSVGRIAEQTNLLALNAAIEAARAGDAGRGFVVVADEVRKLAEQAQRAADDVARLTKAITTTVNDTVGSMQRSSGMVGEIETLGREVSGALQSIGHSAERTVGAAHSLSEIAATNSTLVATVQTSLASIAADAVGHAQSAQQASAAAQEQSAACQQMSAASQVLHGRSNRLRAIVESRGAAHTTPGHTAEFMAPRPPRTAPPAAEATPPAPTEARPPRPTPTTRRPTPRPTPAGTPVHRPTGGMTPIGSARVA